MLCGPINEGVLSLGADQRAKMSEHVTASDNVTGTDSTALIERWDTEYNYLFLIYLVVP